jgi:hypothetical protein
MNINALNHRILYGAVLLLAGAFLTLASAGHAWSDQRQLDPQIAEYQSFMIEHPTASTQIRQNPQLVYDKKFLNSHPEVDHFLKGHPELRQEIARHPDRVFGWSSRDDHRYDRDDRHFGWWHH